MGRVFCQQLILNKVCGCVIDGPVFNMFSNIHMGKIVSDVGVSTISDKNN